VRRLPAFAAALGGVALASPSAALAHGRTVAPADLGSAWEASPLVFVSAAIAVALFAQAFVRLRRRGRTDHAGWGRAVLFAAAVAVATLALVSPIDATGEQYLLSVHMLQHVLIADVAPALALLAIRGPLTFFLLPPPVLRRLAGVRPLRAALGLVLRPQVTFVLWAAVMLTWHAPFAYEAALHSKAVHDLEHVMFIVVGTLAWIQLIDPARQQRLRRAGRIGFALGLLVVGHPIVDGLFLSGSPAYSTYADQLHRVFGLSALTDQRIAAVVMFTEQMVMLGTCVAVLLWPYLRGLRRTRDLRLAS